MRIFAYLILLALILQAQERPKIALVLSGGGARGGAHLGVIKVLEKNHIPIDMIVGTSIGSVVGGLYASGKSSDEIEKILVSTDWKCYITTDFVRKDIPMRKKELDYFYQGHLGLSINKDNDIVLPTGLLKREPLLLKFVHDTRNVADIRDFNKLSIPFRAIATDIKNGDAIILSHGSLAKAMYASSAIPGGFQPILIDGKELVDGGLSKNFPIEVAKKMGADIIIAVDVSEPFDKKMKINSYISVMGQMVNILMRKNADESITLLSKDDVLLTPDLEGYSGLDSDKYAEIIKKGEEVAQKNLAKLRKLSLDNAAYELYKKRYRVQHHVTMPKIDAIEIENPTYVSDEAITKRLHVQLGQPLDADALQEDMMQLYNLTLFDNVGYRIKQKNGKNILVISVTPSSKINGEILAALGFEDDFKGHSTYSLKLGYIMSGINSYGAEWRTHTEIGRNPRIYTEFYQPLDPLERFYIKPSLSYKKTVDVFPIENYTGGFIKGNVEIKYSRKGGRIVLGSHVDNSFRLEFGAGSYRDTTKINIKTPLLDLPEATYSARPLFATLYYDTLDDVNFPSTGFFSALKWTNEGYIGGGDYDYEQIFGSVEIPFTYHANNFTFFAKYGQTYKNNDEDIKRIYGTYSLGGLFNLSGYVPYSFNNDNVLFSVLKYRYQIRGEGLLGVLDTPLYMGFSLESGTTWGYKESLKEDMLHYSGSAYVAADTFLGPIYFAYGRADDGSDSFYLYLGEKF